MKRGETILISLFLAVLILSSFSVIAQEDTNNQDDKTVSAEKANEDLKKAAEKAKEAGKGFKQNQDEKITKEIEIPESLQILARIIFGIKDEKAQFNLLMIYIGVWFLILIIAFKGSQFIPFLQGSKPLSFLFAIILTLLISITGVIKSIVNIIYGLATLFTLLENFPAIATAIAIIILFLIFWFTRIFLKYLNHKISLEKADRIGEESELGIKVARNIGKSVKEDS